MKEPRPHCHLISSAEPIPSGRDYHAMCDDEVKKAAFLTEYDGYERSVASLLNSIRGLCPTCKSMYQTAETKRYLFVILNGELLQQPEEAA